MRFDEHSETYWTDVMVDELCARADRLALPLTNALLDPEAEDMQDLCVACERFVEAWKLCRGAREAGTEYRAQGSAETPNSRIEALLDDPKVRKVLDEHAARRARRDPDAGDLKNFIDAWDRLMETWTGGAGMVDLEREYEAKRPTRSPSAP